MFSLTYTCCSLHDWNTYFLFLTAVEVPTNPCVPSPCGPNSICKEINGHAVCTCLQNFVGSPPSCRPECVVSSDCPQDKACMNQKCTDPCSGTCGTNARCQVVNHNPICSCPPGFTGDPFLRCLKIQRKEYFYLSNHSLTFFKYILLTVGILINYLFLLSEFQYFFMLPLAIRYRLFNILIFIFS